MSKLVVCCSFIFLLVGSAAADTRDNLLVTPAWLAAHLNDAKLVLLHIGPKQGYDGGHIPGARFVELADVLTSDAGLALEMPPAEMLRERLSRLGISNDSQVVVYFGSGWISPATRLVLTLDYAGIDNVRLLDGGLAAWNEQKLPLTSDPSLQKTGTLAALKLRPITVTAGQVQAALGTPGSVVIDARTAAFYDGISTGGGADRPHKTGHIAGARSLSYLTLYSSTGALKSADELAKLFADAGVKTGDTIIGYCHIGQQATAMLFAARTVGYRVLLYDGSFEDWSRRDLPVESNVRK